MPSFVAVAAAGTQPDSRQDRLPEAIGCSDCGLVQRLPQHLGNGVVHCSRCDRALERTAGRSLRLALACAMTTLLLLFPANLLPILQVTILGTSNHSLIVSGVIGIWNQGWPVVAIITGLEIVVLPFIRFGLLAAVLLAARAEVRAVWVAPAFRWSERLDEWAMLDVFLFGCIVGYSRVAAVLPIRIEAGGWCLIAAAIFTLVTRATLERRAIWQRIGPVENSWQRGMIGCTACGYPVIATRDGKPCPRCRAAVWRVRPFSLMRAVALTAAGLVFYPAAYLYPMEYSDQLNTMNGYSIMTGVMKLIQANLWFFAGVVLVASILIPLMKLGVLAWFAVSIFRHSTSRLRLKTKLYRVINVIGRWSHIDVFTVAVFLPLMNLPGFLSVIVGRALPAFLAVVVLTMLASEIFDPRALWVKRQDKHAGH